MSFGLFHLRRDVAGLWELETNQKYVKQYQKDNLKPISLLSVAEMELMIFKIDLELH